MSNSQFFYTSFPDSFFQLSDILGPRSISDAEVAATMYNGQGIVNGSLVDASIVASHILGSNKFYDTFSDAISKSHNVKQEAGTKTELKCFHSRFNEFLSGRFVVTFDDFVNGNVYASVNHDGPKRFLFFNHYLFLALETYTNEPGLHTKHYQQRRIKLAVIFLAIKLVQGVSHWLHAWMRANHFYTFENEAYTGKVSPPIQTDKYQFGNLEIHVESVLFGGYATLIEPPHPFIFQHTIRMGISSVQLTEFTEGRIIHRRLQINSDLISSTSLGLNDCRTPCITFGPTTEYCPGRPVPTCVVAKVPISSTESTTTSGRKKRAHQPVKSAPEGKKVQRVRATDSTLVDSEGEKEAKEEKEEEKEEDSTRVADRFETDPVAIAATRSGALRH